MPWADAEPGPSADEPDLVMLAMRAMAPESVTVVAGWRCWSAPHLPFRRANTAVPPPGPFDPASIAVVEDWYGARGARVIALVHGAGTLVATATESSGRRLRAPASPPRAMPRTGSPDMPAESALVARGYAVEAPVTVLVSGTGGFEASGRAGSPVVVDSVAASAARLGGDLSGRVAGYNELFGPLGDRALVATVEREGALAGLGFAVLDGPWCGVFGMSTVPAARRSGVATAVLGALLSVARERGAKNAYLQVERANEGAAALYGRLGFSEGGRYHYRVSREA